MMEKGQYITMTRVVLVLLLSLGVSQVWADFLPLNGDRLSREKEQQKSDSGAKEESKRRSRQKEGRPNLIQPERYPKDMPRGIEVQLVSSNNVQISWHFKHAVKNKEYGLFRYSQPIDSIHDLRRSEVLGAFRANERVILDKGLDKGRYFYAVVKIDQVAQGDPDLYSGINYTTVPILIGQNPKQKKGSDTVSGSVPDPVTNIRGIVEYKGAKRFIILHWDYKQEENVSFIIYRSRQPIDSIKRLNQAKRVAVLQGQNHRFIDYNEDANGAYFYAVTTRFVGKDGGENRSLKKGENYLEAPVSIGKKYKGLTVTGLKADPVANSVIWLAWKSPNVRQEALRDLRLDIYRHHKPIKNDKTLMQSQRIATIMGNQRSFLDNVPRSRNNYYTVLIRYAPGKIIKNFIKNGNYTTKAPKLQKKTVAQKKSKQQNKKEKQDQKKNNKEAKNKKDSQKQKKDSPDKKKPRFGYSDVFRKLEAQAVSEGILVRWEYQNNMPSPLQDAYVYLVRTSETPTDFETVRRNGQIVKEFKVNRDITGYLDEWGARGQPAYYVLLLGKVKNRILPMDFQTGVNVLAQSVMAPQKEETDEPSAEIASKQKKDSDQGSEVKMPNLSRQEAISRINKVVRRFFYKSKFSKTYKNLIPFSKSSDLLVKSKALLFQGRSLYEMGYYKKALPFFLHQSVKRFFPNEAELWKEEVYRKIQ